MPFEVRDSFGTVGRVVYVKDSGTDASYNVRIELTRERVVLPFSRRVLVTVVPLKDSRGKPIRPSIHWVRCNPQVRYSRFDPDADHDFLDGVRDWHSLALDLLDVYLEEVRASEATYEGPRPTRFERTPVL